MLSREDLERFPRVALGKPSSLKPSVWRVETQSGPVVVKDTRHVRPATRWLARWLVARERRILMRLDSVDRVPHLVATVDRDAIVLSLIPGRPLDAQLFRERPREIVAQLFEITCKLHEIGVFHLDLHQRKNVLVDSEGRLRLVDFGAAVAPGPVVRFLIGGILRYVDRHAVYKYMARFTPEQLSEAEARAVVRYGRVRWLWPFTPHSRREQMSGRARLR